MTNTRAELKQDYENFKKSTNNYKITYCDYLEMIKEIQEKNLICFENRKENITKLFKTENMIETHITKIKTLLNLINKELKLNRSKHLWN